MVLYFDYDHSQKKATEILKNYLVSDGYFILQYAPEAGFIITDYKTFDWGEGKRLLALTIQIHDKVTITADGKMDVPVAGIGWGEEELLKLKTVDKLPYSIQKKTLFTLVDPLDSLGFHLIGNKS